MKMPSKSKAQHNLMALVANNPKASKRLGIPKSVGEEFMKADKGKKFAAGGCATKAEAKSIAKKEVSGHESSMHKMKKGGKVKKYVGGGDVEALKKPVKNADELFTEARNKGKKVVKEVKDVPEDDMPPKDSKGNYIKPRPYKSGGMCGGTKKYARGGGIEVRGKTRGKII